MKMTSTVRLQKTLLALLAAAGVALPLAAARADGDTDRQQVADFYENLARRAPAADETAATATTRGMRLHYLLQTAPCRHTTTRGASATRSRQS